MNISKELKSLVYKFICVIVITLIISIILIIVRLCYLEMTTAINESESKQLNQGKTFIWNDDIESIPVDGTFVKIDFTEGDKIYLTPIE